MYVADIPTVVLDTPVSVRQGPRWHLAARIAFRFWVVYFGIYVCMTQMLASMLPLPVGGIPQFGDIPPMRNLVAWVATSIFGVTQPLVVTGSGSGDKTHAQIDMDAHSITLTGGPPGPRRGGKLSFEQLAPSRLILRGDVAGTPIHMRLALFDRQKFLLVSRGFNWVQEYPFNR